ncbi:hypothetical protein FKM82_015014 [Ascaphus truei]
MLNYNRNTSSELFPALFNHCEDHIHCTNNNTRLIPPFRQLRYSVVKEMSRSAWTQSSCIPTTAHTQMNNSALKVTATLPTAVQEADPQGRGKGNSN